MRNRFIITGSVQGVGLRPEVYRLAVKHSLSGFVANDGGRAVIEVEGSSAGLNLFFKGLVDWFSGQELPFSVAEKLTVDERRGSGFVIHNSGSDSDYFGLDVTADRKLCPSCQLEFDDPDGRRYKYPLVACTDCGPRFSLLNELPIDRGNSSWSGFEMCVKCRTEYEDPEERRFHAQNISCTDCGPQFVFRKTRNTPYNGQTAYESFQAAADYILAGNVCAVKSTGGFHLVCLAGNDQAVQTVRRVKGRDKKPFAVMYPDMDTVRSAFPNIAPDESEILQSQAAPVVILPGIDRALAAGVYGSLSYTGCFLPYNGIYLLLTELVGKPLVVTSANESGRRIALSANELYDWLGSEAAVLDHSLEIIRPMEDSVVRTASDTHVLLRSGRGYSPVSIYLPFETGKSRLCLGADFKNTIALARGSRIIVSPHNGEIGALGNRDFGDYMESFRRLYRFEPEYAVCDMHPGYHTAAAAEEAGLPVIQVQHHHAHALALMAEHCMERDRNLFCAVFDGTGFGTDGHVWGGEFLAVRYDGFERAGHLKYFRNPGGDRFVREGWRAALSLLFDIHGERALTMNIQLPEQGTIVNAANYYKIWESAEEMTSSAGRLFDAAASLLGILHVSSWEGEAGMLLESLYDRSVTDIYPFNDAAGEVDWSDIITGLASEKDARLGATRFINTMAEIVLRASLPYGELGISGGVFQNSALVKRIKELAHINKIRLYLHNRLPPGDGNISAGQAAYIF